MKVVTAVLLFATVLPGFRAERIATGRGFITSLASDSRGIIYYTTHDGGIYRLDGELIAEVATEADGNSGLLGMALADDETAVVHYTTPRQTHDVVARIDIPTGVETPLHQFVCDIEVPERGSLSEHHGGNPIVAPDGSVFVGIGDNLRGVLAADPMWNAGKIFRIAPDGTATQYARGLRNPFDMAWDAARQRLIVGDNGPDAGDEIHIIHEGADCGWPFSWGAHQNGGGSVVPDYVFPTTVAPTGMALTNTTLGGGLLVATFVGKAIYYFRMTDPLADPIALFSGEAGPLIDVTQTPAGQIYFANSVAVYRLITPSRGDCNGDGVVTRADYDALLLELTDGEESMTSAQDGAHRGSWGCDATGDGLINAADKDELVRMVSWRRRLVRR
jgi:glucose/arabinose dehydrogenase